MEPEENINSKDKKDVLPLRALRTYGMDIKEKIKGEKISLSDIAVAEAQRSRADEIYKIPRKIPFWEKRAVRTLLLIAVILAVGTTIVGLFLSAEKEKRELPTDASYLKEIFVSLDGIEKIFFNGKPPRREFVESFRIKSAEIASRANRGLISIFPVEKKNNEGGMTESNPDASSIMDILETKMPSILKRNLSQYYFLGISLPESEPVLVLKISSPSYGTAFSGMIEWEKNLLNDLGSLISKNPVSGTQAGLEPAFEDKSLRNKDVRFLRDQNGKIFFLYSVVDEKTIVIAGGELALEKTLSALIK